jgi:hypothetical protein
LKLPEPPIHPHYLPFREPPFRENEVLEDSPQPGIEIEGMPDLAGPRGIHTAWSNRLIEVDVTVADLDVEAALRIYTDPSFIMNRRSLSAIIGKGNKLPFLALKALRQTMFFHTPPPICQLNRV